MEMLQKEIPDGYESKLDFFETQKAIQFAKRKFEQVFSENLSLVKVKAPKALERGKGLQDDLAGTQEPVSFETEFSDREVEIIHSLAKWKRYTLGKQDFDTGTGILTEMDAIRKEEEVDHYHSVHVDQWDWEVVLSQEQRDLDFLKRMVRKIYRSILETEQALVSVFEPLEKRLPRDITFVHAQELEDRYPELTPEEREREICKKHGAVFIQGIGHPLKSGEPHDIRAADYDDWYTMTEEGRGLNGDIIVWDDIQEKALEISSMGIRVDPEALEKQMEMLGQSHRKDMKFHRGILEGELPHSIGGGIGRSRLYLYLLHKAHIGEVQPSVWPEEVKQSLESEGINLL